VGGGDTVCI